MRRWRELTIDTGGALARLPVHRNTGQPLPVRVVPGTVRPLGDSGQLGTVDTSVQIAESP
ncbi:hypothetical protein ACFVQ4_02585 [Streptomyces laurentii]|uniref:hypothetical protein n=1 Tax=Streptomyces laurentii TaxID=39478 RepID=UPI0036B00D0C